MSVEGAAIAGEMLVLGIGNDLLGDDAAGLIAAAALNGEGVEVRTDVRSGLALLDAVVGYRRVLLIDSVTSGRAPGTIFEYALDPSPVRSPSVHYLGYGEALAVGAALGLEMPERVVALAMERSSEIRIGADLSAGVSAAIPEFIERARAIVREWSSQAARA